MLDDANPYCYVVLQDFGSDGGGWGVAAWSFVGHDAPRPVVYTGSNTETITALGTIARILNDATKLPTRLVRYQDPENLVTYDEHEPKGA